MDFPSTLTSIGASAFRYCSNLEHVYFNGPPPTSVGSNPFQYVKSGCRGYYGFQHESAWSGVVDANGMWKGLLMVELPRVVANIVSADVVAGSITIGWNTFDYPTGTTFKIFRAVGDECPNLLTSGVTSVTFTDDGYSKAGFVGSAPSFDPVYYQIEPEFGEISGLRSSLLKTRNRYGLFVGIDEYEFLSNLEACVSDADGWKNAFITTDYQQIINSTGTKENILGSLHDWSNRVKPGDTFFYAHSGHGDVDVLCSYRSKSVNTSADINASEFASELMKFPKGVGVIVVLDTCKSGSIPPISSGTQNKLLMASASSPAKRSFVESVIYAMNSKPVKRLLLSTSSGESDMSYPRISSPDEIGWLTSVDSTEYARDGLYSSNCLQTAGWRYGGADYDRSGTVDFNELGEFAAYWFERTFDEYQMTPQMFSQNILSSVCAGRVPLPNVYDKLATPDPVIASVDKAYRVTVNWNSVHGAEKYTIACITNNVTNFYPTAGTNVIFRDLRPGAVLTVYVKAKNKMDVGPCSAIATGVATSHINIEESVARYDWSTISAERENPINSNGTINYDRLNIDHDGDGITSFQEFIAGTDPLNDKSVFSAKISIKANGTPNITWVPDAPELRATRVYRTLGKASLTDIDWVDVTDSDQSAYRFFKVTVDLP